MRLIQTRWYPEWHGTRPVGNPPEKRVFEQKFFAVPGSPSSVKNQGYRIVVRTKLIAVISAGNRFDGLENRNPVGNETSHDGCAQTAKPLCQSSSFSEPSIRLRSTLVANPRRKTSQNKTFVDLTGPSIRIQND